MPPKELLIMDVEGQKLEGVIGPYDEGSNVILICEAEGGMLLLRVLSILLFDVLDHCLLELIGAHFSNSFVFVFVTIQFIHLSSFIHSFIVCFCVFSKHCKQNTGKPSPSVNWYQANRLIDSTYTIGPHGLVRNELNIRNLNRSDFMSILTCRASNNNVTEPISATVILDMNRKWNTYIHTHTNKFTILSFHLYLLKFKSSNINL